VSETDTELQYPRREQIKAYELVEAIQDVLCCESAGTRVLGLVLDKLDGWLGNPHDTPETRRFLHLVRSYVYDANRRAAREERKRRGKLREITPWNDYTKRPDIVLYEQRSDEKVFWSSIGNSYVVVGDETRRDQKLPYWTWPDGSAVALLSINGASEVRWEVTPGSLGTPTDAEAVEYFGLTPA
jgi:hypothetical protein